MSIKVKIASNYGNEAIYPICEKAQTFARLAGTKTLTRPTLNLIKRLGYEVEVEQVSL